VSQLYPNQNCPPRVAIVICNWNGRHHLKLCLPSIFAQDFQAFEVYVIDNASTDGSAAWVRQHYPQVKLIENEANGGLCMANNQGTVATQAEYVFILNNDTELKPDCLGHLYRSLDSDARLGMVASKMLLSDRQSMIESAGITIDRAGIAWGLASGDLDRPAEALIRPVFGACGGAALYRRLMLLDIGLWDADFFVYLEDADVAWRAQWAGWRCAYASQAVVYHSHSATIKEGSPFKTRLLGRNKVWLIGKTYPLPQLLLYTPLILFYDLLGLAYALVTGRGLDALKGRIEALRQLPALLAKRRRIVRRVSAGEMMRRLHPLESPVTLFRRTRNIAKAAVSGRIEKQGPV
jgi:hypothetical protein